MSSNTFNFPAKKDALPNFFSQSTSVPTTTASTDKPTTLTDKPTTLTDKPTALTDKPTTLTDKLTTLKEAGFQFSSNRSSSVQNVNAVRTELPFQLPMTFGSRIDDVNKMSTAQFFFGNKDKQSNDEPNKKKFKNMFDDLENLKMQIGEFRLYRTHCPTFLNKVEYALTEYGGMNGALSVVHNFLDDETIKWYYNQKFSDWCEFRNAFKNFVDQKEALLLQRITTRQEEFLKHDLKMHNTDYKIYFTIKEKIKLIQLKFPSLEMKNILELALGCLPDQQVIIKLKQFVSLDEFKFLQLCKEEDVKNKLLSV